MSDTKPTNPLSSYLRAASRGEKTPPPAEVVSTQRKYGFGGKIPRATVMALLAAFAMGTLSPSLEAKPVENKAPKRAVQGAVVGAVAGAVIGNNTGKGSSSKGAAIGAGVGLVLGTVLGQQQTTKEQGKVIKQQERDISERDRTIEDQQTVIAEQSRTIAAQRRSNVPANGRAVAERDVDAELRAEAKRAGARLMEVRRQMESAERARAQALRTIEQAEAKLATLSAQELELAQQVSVLEGQVANLEGGESLAMHRLPAPADHKPATPAKSAHDLDR